MSISSIFRARLGTTRELDWTKQSLFLFLKLNLWLCSTSVVLTVITAHALGASVGSLGGALALPPLLFYFIYTEDRRSVSPEDWTNQPTRTTYVTRYDREFLYTEIFALLMYELYIFYYIFGAPGRSHWFLVFGQLPFVVLAAYDRFKRVPSGDSVAVGATWAFTGLFALFLSTGQPVTHTAGIVFFGWFLIVFAGVESRNVDDATGDTDAEKTTLAGHLGPQAAKTLVFVLKLSGVLVFWLFSGPVTAALVVGYLLLLRSFRQLTRRANVLVAE